MQIIKIKDIKISKYRRNPPYKLEEIIKDIKENGLLYPIVIDKNNNLIDGYIRLEAFKTLGKDEIPCIVKE